MLSGFPISVSQIVVPRYFLHCRYLYLPLTHGATKEFIYRFFFVFSRAQPSRPSPPVPLVRVHPLQ